MRLWIAVCGTTLACALGAQSPAEKPAGPPPPAGNAENGKKIYASYGCFQCHNYAANGGAAGPRLAPRPLAYREFARYVRKPTDQMPPYTAKVVTDKELADIYAFLLTIPPASTPSSMTILK
jgi:ubiquinol-cytochrome c reductase cytochrome c subunit